jgi:hypothetical protein
VVSEINVVSPNNSLKKSKINNKSNIAVSLEKAHSFVYPFTAGLWEKSYKSLYFLDCGPN